MYTSKLNKIRVLNSWFIFTLDLLKAISMKLKIRPILDVLPPQTLTLNFYVREIKSNYLELRTIPLFFCDDCLMFILRLVVWIVVLSAVLKQEVFVRWVNFCITNSGINTQNFGCNQIGTFRINKTEFLVWRSA